ARGAPPAQFRRIPPDRILLGIGHSGPGNVEELVLLQGIVRDLIEVAPRVIDKFDLDVIADPFKVPLLPALKGKGRSPASSFMPGPVVRATCRVGLDPVGWPIFNVDPPAVRHPSRYPGRKNVVGILDATVVL